MSRVIELRLKKLEAVMIPQKLRRVHIVAGTETATAHEVMAEMIKPGSDDMFILLVSPKAGPSHHSEARRAETDAAR